VQVLPVPVRRVGAWEVERFQHLEPFQLLAAAEATFGKWNGPGRSTGS
jgi:hypothetical protein